MTLGNIIDAGLNPIFAFLKRAYIRWQIVSSDRNAQVEAQHAEQARRNELYFQQRSLSLRTRLADLERNQIGLPSKVQNWLATGSTTRTGTEG